MFGILALFVLAAGVIALIGSAFASPEKQPYGSTSPRSFIRRVGGIVAAVGVVLLLFATVTTVDEGEVHVPILFGESQEPITQKGWAWKHPLASIVVMPTRTVEVTFEGKTTQGETESNTNLQEINALSAEGAQVGVDVTVQYHIDPTMTAEVYATVGTQWESVLVLPRVRNTVRDCLPGYTFEEARTTKRGEASTCMLKDMQDALAPRGIVIEDLLLRDMRASAELQTAIDQKLEAQTNEQRAVFEQREALVRAETARITAEGLANARIEQAQGEAEAIRLEADAEAYANDVIAKSLTPALLQLRVYEQLGDKTVVISPDGGIPPIPILPLD